MRKRLRHTLAIGLPILALVAYTGSYLILRNLADDTGYIIGVPNGTRVPDKRVVFFHENHDISALDPLFGPARFFDHQLTRTQLWLSMDWKEPHFVTRYPRKNA